MWPLLGRSWSNACCCTHRAVLLNWLYYLALGLSIPVLPRVIATIVNADGSSKVSSASAILGGDVEAVDKIITFCCVGFLGALSDVHGRRPLMAYSALGFAATCWLQATATDTTAVLYLADLVDGVSSCMNTVCQVRYQSLGACRPLHEHSLPAALFHGHSLQPFAWTQPAAPCMDTACSPLHGHSLQPLAWTQLAALCMDTACSPLHGHSHVCCYCRGVEDVGREADGAELGLGLGLGLGAEARLPTYSYSH